MPRFATIKPLVFICLVFIGHVKAQELVLEVYDTYHVGTKVASVVDDLLKPGETIKVFGNKLIIRASNDTHEKVLYVLNEIDRAPKNFLISIRATDQYESKKRYSTSQLRYMDDDTVIHVNQNQQPEDGVIVYKGSSRDGKISVSVTDRDNLTTRDSNLIQQVRGLEGQQAYISVGDEVPIRQLIWANGIVIPHTTLDSASTGFFVTPTLSKEQVTLHITFQKQERDGKNQIKKQHAALSTHLRIPLNEWAPLAGFSHQQKAIRNGTVLSTKHKGNQQQGIEIKVETVN